MWFNVQVLTSSTVLHSFCVKCDSWEWVWGNGRVAARSIQQRNRHVSLRIIFRVLPGCSLCEGGLVLSHNHFPHIQVSWATQRRRQSLTGVRPQLYHLHSRWPPKDCTSTTSCVPLWSNCLRLSEYGVQADSWDEMMCFVADLVS